MAVSALTVRPTRFIARLAFLLLPISAIGIIMAVSPMAVRPPRILARFAFASANLKILRTKVRVMSKGEFYGKRYLFIQKN